MGASAQLIENGAANVVGMADDPELVRDRLRELGVDRSGDELVIAADAGLPLTFDDDSFELVVCHDLAERIDADAAWIGELRRVLAPEGYLVCAIANDAEAAQSLGQLQGDRDESPMSRFSSSLNHKFSRRFPLGSKIR